MKILKIALISIGALIVVLLIAAVIFIKTFDVNRYKPQITQEASKALARKVDFQKINLGISLFQGISLKVSGLTIADDPSFGKEDFLKVKDIFVGVDVLGYLLRRKISITGVLINSPQVIIIRQQDGSINVTTISKPAEAGKEIVKSAPATAAMAVPAILVSSIKSVLGQVIYIDNSFSPPLRLEAADLELLVSRVSLTESFPFVVEAAVLSAKKNIHIEGKARFDLKTNEVTVTDLQGATELANIILEQIPVVFPMAKGAVLPQTMKGDLNLTVDKLIAGPAGLGTLAADGVLNNGVLRFKELAVPIQNIGAKVKITGNKTGD